MGQNRQLAAIMFTDIEGYTALMQHDEKNAMALRQKHREIFESSTQKFNGKIIQYFGDGTLSVFKSSVEAVKCSIEMQLAFITERISVRIGIHVGDIVYSEEDIIGDAVNIASRIESCAVSGSILISDKVQDQIRSHQDIKTQFIDAYDFKNVEDALPIYAVSNEGLLIPDPETIKGKLKAKTRHRSKTKKMTRNNVLASILVLLIVVTVAISSGYFNKKPMPSDYSIAVLPFGNLSNDDEFEIFTDGITEDILTNLSKLKDLHVISRTSVMQFKGTEKTIPEIAKELGVSYILEGSIRKYDNDIRVSAQLIDAESDEHVWAETYDKTLTDIFALQTEVSNEIVEALHLNISSEEENSLVNIATTNIEAYKSFLLGKKEADKRSKESLKRSIEFYDEAITLDPNYAEAYAEKANSIYLETYYSGRDPVQASRLANENLDMAEKINNKISRIYSVRGLIYNIEAKHEAAKDAFEKAIKLSPNDLTARHQFSTFYYYTRQYDKQLEQAKIAYSLDPLSFATANSYFTALTANYKYDEALQLMKKVEEQGNENNAFVINRSYFRLYIDKRDYSSAISPLLKMVDEEPAFNRFLAYCYGKVGDTSRAYRTIKVMKDKVHPSERNHQLAIAFAGIKETDSVLYYLDTIRNKESRMLRREYKEFIGFLQDDPRFVDVLKSHGIE